MKRVFLGATCWMADARLDVCEAITAEEEEQWADLTVGKDRRVLAAAFKTNADVLVTLDRKHVLTDMVRAEFPIPVQDTKEFLTEFGR